MRIKRLIPLLIIFAVCIVFAPLIFPDSSGEIPDNLDEIEGTLPPGVNEEEEENVSVHNPGGNTSDAGNDENPGFPGDENGELSGLPSRGNYENWDDDSLLEALSFLESPLPGAKVTTRDTQLPGAPRTYRNGTHEGLDFYEGYCNISVKYGDPVFAAGPGTVYRIDHDFVELPTDEREILLETAWKMDETPAEILDMLRGRQVWLIHSNGIITRYAHLSDTAGNLEKGDSVEAGDYIGNVGNSGTSEGAEGNTLNSHLHFEIWIGESYLGEGLSPAEIRTLWKRIIEE
ncbi:MAG: M23 family metallopeptidase [Dethiobacteria bacterium]